MIIIALLSSVVTVVAYGVTIKTDVDYLKAAVSENPAYQQLTNERLTKQDKDIALNELNIDNLQTDITEIKSDVKELLRR